MKVKTGLAALVTLWGMASYNVAAAAMVDAVEYHYNGHYFMTAFPVESAAIDSGAIPAWTRTGYSFKVQSEQTTGYSPICRFYSTGVTRGSHFYTADAGECGVLKSDTHWKYEADAFFAAPVASNGTCPAGKALVYRLYNNRLSGAPNHRYTTDANVRADMVSAGWIAEGVAFCAEDAGTVAPADPALAQRITTKMVGGTWRFSYTYNGSQYIDTLAFTTVVNDPASTASPYYAQGTNQYGLPTTARYNTQTGQIEVRSTFAIPATDYYTVQFNTDNQVTGCYYFLPTNSYAVSGSCTNVTGSR